MKRTGHVGWEYVQVIHGKEKYVLKVKSMILMHINNEHRSKILFNSLITEKNKYFNHFKKNEKKADKYIGRNADMGFCLEM